MEKKSQKQVKRFDLVANYLRNPYNLSPKQDRFDYGFKSMTPKIQHRTFTKKMYSTSKNKLQLPDLNGTNAFYLTKTSQAFRETRENWKSQLQTCLSSKSILGVPNHSKIILKPVQTPSMHIIRRPNLKKMEPILEIQVQKLF